MTDAKEGLTLPFVTGHIRYRSKHRVLCVKSTILPEPLQVVTRTKPKCQCTPAAKPSPQWRPRPIAGGLRGWPATHVWPLSPPCRPAAACLRPVFASTWTPGTADMPVNDCEETLAQRSRSSFGNRGQREQINLFHTSLRLLLDTNASAAAEQAASPAESDQRRGGVDNR